MTVSRYLRDPEKVSQKTRDKIEEVITATGYIPNKAPALLSNSKSFAIGVLVPSLTNQVFADVISGIEAITEPAGYQVMLAHYGYSPEVEEKHITSLLSYQIDGLILSDFEHTNRTLAMIEMAGIPTVEIMGSSKTPIHQSVGFDNKNAGYLMTKALLEKGYKHPVYLGAQLDRRTELKREGYRDALQEFGVSPIEMLTEEGSSFSLGRELLTKTLQQHPEVDSFFCTNDDIATGVVFECQHQGISIPEEIAVAGFHGLDVGQSLVPRLASVMTPRKEIGKIAAEQLLSRIERKTTLAKNVCLDIELDFGESV